MNTEAKVRVMLVDDSAVIRGFLARFLSESPDVEIVASVYNGKQALETIEGKNIDVVILDIEMPIMDGIEALPKILEKSPITQVIMASTLTQKNADITFKALQMGAKECLAKPTSAGEMTSAENFKNELINKTLSLGRRAQAKRRRSNDNMSVVQRPQGSAVNLVDKTRLFHGPFKALAIGSSTGGPQALFEVLSPFRGGGFNYPIFITQHMPPTFTKILAENIEKKISVPSFEAEDGMAVTDGNIYVAPGDYHMHLESNQMEKRIKLSQDPPENYCRPAVDAMLRSLSAAYGHSLLTLILTGMGHDGLHGAKALFEKKGVILAQDEETSVVWGMPGAVVKEGVCHKILPVGSIGVEAKRIMERGL